MANNIPPIPYKTKMTNESGYISEAWSKFIRQMFERLGGTATIQDETQTGNIPQDLSAIQRQIDFLKQGPIL